MRHYTENLRKIYKNIGGNFEYSLECFIYDTLGGDPETYTRPAMLICPGGAYAHVSDREGVPIALSFLAKGFNCYVLTYSVAIGAPDEHFPIQLLQAAAAIDYIKSKAAEHRTDASKISVCGFSAGGHLAGMISCLFDHESIKKAFPKKDENYFRPYASVLSYAVLSSDPHIAHMGSFENLTGKDQKLMEYLSLEKRVSEKTPPAFIWCTSDDAAVDCRSSLMYGAALREFGTKFEMHVYPKGNHGISLANKLTSNGREITEDDFIAGWVDLAADFLLKRLPAFI